MPAKLIENFNPSEWTSYVREGSQRWKNNKTGEAAVQIDNVITSTFIVPHADDEATDLQGNNPTSTVYIASGYFFPNATESAPGVDVGPLDPFGFVDEATAKLVADKISAYLAEVGDGAVIGIRKAEDLDIVSFTAVRYLVRVGYKGTIKNVDTGLLAQSFLGGISYANGQVRELTKPTLDGMFADW